MVAGHPPPRDVAAETAELRALVREAHGAIKDLDRLLAEYRRAAADAARDARERAFEAADAELTRFAAQLQQQANRLAAELNASVRRAQEHIVKQLTVSEVFETADGKTAVRFTGTPFDDQVPPREPR